MTGHGVPTIGGLEWMGARAYDPVSRGFLSIDPLAPVTGAGWAGNPYAYAGNDPLHALDPLGLSPVTDKDLRAYGASLGIDALKNRMILPFVGALLAAFPKDFLASLLNTEQGALMVSWALGLSPKTTRYGPNSDIATAMRNHSSADELREKVQAAGRIGNVAKGPYRGYYSAGRPFLKGEILLGGFSSVYPRLNPNIIRDALTAVSFPTASTESRTLLTLGSYNLEAAVVSAGKGSAIVQFTATNQTTLGSGVSPLTVLRPFFDSIPGRTGALSEVGQEVTWTEEVEW